VSSILSWDINSFIRFIHSKEKFVRIVGWFGYCFSFQVSSFIFPFSTLEGNNR
jgi:hypothetical protein